MSDGRSSDRSASGAFSSARGALAIGAGAALWGLFWIPLRHLDTSGIGGLWSVALVGAAALLPALAFAAYRGELAALARRDVRLVGATLGLSGVLYFAGVLHSDVVRVVLLFYLLPVWTILAARVLHGEPIRVHHVVVIAAAFLGLWLLLGGGARLPLPRDAGDACGLAAGMCWGIGLALLRGRAGTPPYASTFAALLVMTTLAGGAATALGMLLPEAAAPPPRGDAAWRALPLALGFGVPVLFPALLGQIWGARQVSAATASLLTMTEILVATLSAWWLIGTTLDAMAFAGGALIVAAVLLDLVRQRT